MSLWKVSDTATQHLMATYYENLKGDEGRSEALRKAQRDIAGSKHPCYWASSIASGAWRPIDWQKKEKLRVNELGSYRGEITAITDSANSDRRCIMTLLFHASFRSRSCVMPFLLATLLCLPACLQGPRPPAPEPQAGLPEQIQTAAQMKTRAEQSAADLKKAYGEKKVSEEDYTKVRSLYVDAQGAIDGWVTALQTEVEQGRDPRKSDKYSQSLQEAAGQAEIFIANARSLLVKSGVRTGGTSIIGDLLKVLGDLGVQVWKEYQSEKQKQKEALVKRLESLKWKPFDDI